MTETYYPPQKKKKNVVPIVIAVVLACVLLGVGVFFGVKYLIEKANPMLSVTKAIGNSVNAAGKSELAGTLNDVLDNGSVTVSANLSELMNEMMGFPINVGATANITFDKAGGNTAADLKATIGGIDLADISMTCGKESAAVKSEVLFGHTAYGLDFKNAEKNFPNSAFAAGREYDFGLTEEQVKEFTGFLSGLSSGKSAQPQKKFLNKFIEKFVRLVQEKAEISSEKGTLAFADDTVNTKNVIVKADGKAFAEIAKSTMNVLRNNEIEGTEEFLNSVVFLLSRTNSYIETVDDLREELDEAVEEIDTLAEDGDLDSFLLTVTFRISSAGSQLIGLDVHVENEEYDCMIVSVFGPDWKKLQTINMTVDVSQEYVPYGGDEEAAIRFDSSARFSYIVSEDSKDRFSAELKVVIDGDDTARGVIEWDKKSGEYSAGLTADYEEYGVRGNLLKTGKDVNLTVDAVTIEGEEMRFKDIGATLLFDAPKVEPISGYKDVLTLSEDEVTELFESLEGFSDDLSAKIQEILFSSIFGSFGSFGN